LERVTYRDGKVAGALHAGLMVAAAALLGAAVQSATARRGRPWSVVATATATWICLGGTSLARTGLEMSRLLERGDVEAARRLLPSLCGRDPATLDGVGLTRAALESVAENTSDAQVAPLLWATAGGAPAVLAYRGINTLDSMIGHRSPRYIRFGWAAARLDDLANYVAARATAVLVVTCAPLVGGSPSGAVRAWLSDAARHPSPNAGVVEAAFAGALGVRLGGPTQYHHELQIRPTLGDGDEPTVADLRRAVALSRAVQAVAAVLIASAYRRRP
jgi:adenosylcobinamide-phosphate synthase